MAVDGLDALLLDPLHARVQAGDAGQVGRAVFHAVGVLVQMAALGALHAGAAGPGAGDLNPFPDIHPADAHGSHQALVAGEADDVRAESVQVHRYHAGGLADIQDQVDAPLAAGLADRRDVLHRADDIGSVVHHHRDGVLLKRRMMSWGSTQPMRSKSTQSTSTPSCSSFQSGRRVAL